MANLGGQFNYALKKTGFLGEAKMRAKRISQNPKRFLETLAEKDLEIVPLECPGLDGFIDHLKNRDRDRQKAMNIMKRRTLARKRTFLLNLATSSTISQSDSCDGIETLQEREECHDEQKIDGIIETFLEQIRSTDLSTIEIWVSTMITLKELDLPYGLPQELKLPADPNNIKNLATMDDSLIDFIESTNDDFLLLDGEYHTKLEEIAKKIENNFEEISQPNWSLKETALLSYVVNSNGESFTMSPTSTLLAQLTSRLFLDKTREEIIAQKYRLKTKRSLEERLASVIRDWIKDKKELQGKVDQAWKEMTKKRLANLEKILEKKRQEKICQAWADQLDQLRKAKCEKIRQLKILAGPVEEEIAGKMKLQREQEELRRAMIKLNVKNFEEAKLRNRLDEIKKREKEKNELKELERIQSDRNKSRVDFRTQRLEERTKTEKEKQMAKEAERQWRETILESTKEPVEIEYDPVNVIADTHASAVRRFETLKSSSAEDEAMIKFFRERYSFSAETILKDRRNRVESKLREAGLMEGNYARQVLLAMEPKPKPHLDTQIKFQYDDV